MKKQKANACCRHSPSTFCLMADNDGRRGQNPHTASPFMRGRRRCLLRQTDSLVGAHARASAALRAHIRVNRVLFAFRNSPCGALVDACTTGNAVVTNNVSHKNPFFKNSVYNVLYTYIEIGIPTYVGCKDTPFPRDTYI